MHYSQYTGDYNLFWWTGTISGSYWGPNWNWDGSSPDPFGPSANTSLSTWQTNCSGGGGTGCDSSSAYSDPAVDSTYHFSSSSPATGMATNLTSLCSGGAPALAYLCYDKPVNTGVGGSVYGNARPSSGAWDAGPYNHTSSTPTVTQVCTANSTNSCTVTSNIPSGTILLWSNVNEDTSPSTFTLTDSCGDTWSTPIVGIPGYNAVYTSYTKTTCAMTSGTSTISVGSGSVGTNVLYVFSVDTSASSVGDVSATYSSTSGYSSFSVGPTSSIAGTNDVCFASFAQASYSGPTFSVGAGWTSTPGTNSDSADGRYLFTEYKNVTSGAVTATASSSLSAFYGATLQCLKRSNEPNRGGRMGRGGAGQNCPPPFTSADSARLHSLPRYYRGHLACAPVVFGVRPKKHLFSER